MRIRLSGGKGGVGSSLVSAWRHEHQLTVLDRRTEPTHGVRDLVGEVEDPKALAEALEGAEAVVDLAALLPQRSEEHTSELQSRGHLVCRLLHEKKNKTIILLMCILS